MTSERTMTVGEAARALGLSRPAYYAAAKRGEVPAVRVGRRVLVPRVQFDRFAAGEPWRVQRPEGREPCAA